MNTVGGIAASLSGRYATALFSLSAEQGAISTVEQSLATLEAAAAGSDDLRALVRNPRVGRGEGARAIVAVAEMLGLDPLTTKYLGALGQNGRLDQIGPVTRDFRTLAAAHRGEVRAEVTSAHILSDTQIDELKAQLKRRVGSDVSLTTRTDPGILGGLIVKIGSQMIDSSILTRLNTLAHTLKG